MHNPISQHGVQGSAFNDDLSSLLHIAAATQNPVVPLRLSLSQMTTLRWSLTDEVMQLKHTGFDAIGLWRPKLTEFSDDYAAEMLTRARLPVSSLSFTGGFTGGCGLSYLDAIEDGRQAIDQAEAVGAKTVIVVGGSRNGHTIRHSQRLVVEGIQRLADFAELAQIKLSVLPMHPFFSKQWTYLNSLDQTLDVLQAINHPLVGLAFDTYHLWEETRVLERIPEIAAVTQIVQVSDSPGSPRSEQDRRIPGDGIIPLQSLIQAFQWAGFAGYFDIQVWSGNVWKSNYTHLIEQTHATVKAMSLRVVAAN